MAYDRQTGLLSEADLTDFDDESHGDAGSDF
jgi:hypothetical protein